MKPSVFPVCCAAFLAMGGPAKALAAAAPAPAGAPVAASTAAPAAVPPAGPAAAAEPSPEKKALEKLTAENQLEREKLSAKLRKSSEERDELMLRNAILQEKLKLDLADVAAQEKKLEAENALADEQNKKARKALDPLVLENQLEREKLTARLRKLSDEKEELGLKNLLLQEKLKFELADLMAQQRRLEAENALAQERNRKDLVALTFQRDKLKLDNEIEREKIMMQVARNDLEKSNAGMEFQRIDLASRKLKFRAEEFDSKTAELKVDLDLRAKKEDWKSETNREPEYPKEPFANGRLTISDRRIPLNGPIMRGMADFVTERIHFYNNKSEELPIFIVIDKSPGGSVMEGYRIVKAMQASKAPIYVVVKSFAASMAAVITALAPHSYAYPNAVILHHQMSSFVFGNMTQMKEQLEIAKEWYRRLGDPVSKRMGLSLDEFTKQMYAHNSDGDWEEFADKAKGLKWVDDVVHEIRETGIVKDPDRKPAPKPGIVLLEEADSKGERFVRLPRLEPFDLYYLYNRDGYYR